jgi:glucosamine-6-phosphate deaminase
LFSHPLQADGGVLKMSNAEPIRFQVDLLKFEVYESREAAGSAAAFAAAEAMRAGVMQSGDLGVIFATGASQLAMLRALTGVEDVPWKHIVGFHMDEYENLSADHSASFRRYLRDELLQKVPIKEFHEIDGSSSDVDSFCGEYAAKLRAANPRLCLLGIGENGHLAFNDPFLCSFDDPVDVRLVSLDAACREQQVAEGWFATVENVPARAITLTIPPLIRTPKLIVSVPGIRKAHIVRRVIEESMSNACPATLLKTHRDATVYLDDESSSQLMDILPSSMQDK